MLFHVKHKSIIIVGSGPAGISTALCLKQLLPKIAENMLVLEKATHPRHKLCGGGLTAYAEEMLARLKLTTTAPSCPVHKVRFYCSDKPVDFARDNLMRIVRRDEFDADLVQQARQRGIVLNENERMLYIRRDGDNLIVETSKATYTTPVLVGADGANSIVRRKLLHEDESRVSRLMEVALPVRADQTPEFQNKMAIFDFRPMLSDNLQGYLWEFPSYIAGEPHLNCGVFDSRIHPGQRANLRGLLQQKLHHRGLTNSDLPLEGHPERWFRPGGRYSAPNVVLVGDAAGIEPWLGEGISIALGYGPVAARAIQNAFTEQDFSFADYASFIHRDKLGKLLNRNRLIAKYFYAKSFRPLLSLFGKSLQVSFNLRSRRQAFD